MKKVKLTKAEAEVFLSSLYQAVASLKRESTRPAKVDQTAEDLLDLAGLMEMAFVN